MGYRPRSAKTRASGACLPGHSHQAVPVDLSDGTTVGHVCAHCLVRLRGGFPQADDGTPLPMLSDPSAPPRRRPW